MSPLTRARRNTRHEASPAHDRSLVWLLGRGLWDAKPHLLSHAPDRLRGHATLPAASRRQRGEHVCPARPPGPPRPRAWRGATTCAAACAAHSSGPPVRTRTNRTRLVPSPVLIGHTSSLPRTAQQRVLVGSGGRQRQRWRRLPHHVPSAGRDKGSRDLSSGAQEGAVETFAPVSATLTRCAPAPCPTPRALGAIQLRPARTSCALPLHLLRRRDSFSAPAWHP